MPFVFTKFRLIALSAFGGYLHARDIKVAWGCMLGGFHELKVIFSIFIIPVCHLDTETDCQGFRRHDTQAHDQNHHVCVIVRIDM